MVEDSRIANGHHRLLVSSPNSMDVSTTNTRKRGMDVVSNLRFETLLWIRSVFVS